MYQQVAPVEIYVKKQQTNKQKFQTHKRFKRALHGHENDTTQPKTDKWLSSPSHFSSFFTV